MFQVKSRNRPGKIQPVLLLVGCYGSDYCMLGLGYASTIAHWSCFWWTYREALFYLVVIRMPQAKCYLSLPVVNPSLIRECRLFGCFFSQERHVGQILYDSNLIFWNSGLWWLTVVQRDLNIKQKCRGTEWSSKYLLVLGSLPSSNCLLAQYDAGHLLVMCLHCLPASMEHTWQRPIDVIFSRSQTKHKLLGTSASLLLTSALLVVTRSYQQRTLFLIASCYYQ